MIRLFVTIGTRDGVKVGDLMGIIAGEGGIPGDHVGKIDLQESHALVEVRIGRSVRFAQIVKAIDLIGRFKRRIERRDRRTDRSRRAGGERRQKD